MVLGRVRRCQHALRRFNRVLFGTLSESVDAVADHTPAVAKRRNARHRVTRLDMRASCPFAAGVTAVHPKDIPVQDALNQTAVHRACPRT